MRKKIKFSLAVILAFFFVTSCSKSDDSSNPIGENQKTTEETPKKNEENKDEKKNDDKDDKSDQNKSKQFVYKALVEDVTGTWCPACPRASKAIENAKKAQTYKDRFIPVAIHHNNGGFTEPMHIDKNRNIIRYFYTLPGNLKFSGYPHFMLNRNRQLHSGYAHTTIFTFLDATPTSPIGIKISSNLTETSGNVSVSFKSKENISNLKYHIFILEDKIIAPQNDGGAYVSPYEHNDVVRDFYGNANGNDLGSFSATNDEIIKSNQDFTYTLLSKDKLKNVKVVVFVTNQAGEVLNAQVAKANETKDYQYAE